MTSRRSWAERTRKFYFLFKSSIRHKGGAPLGRFWCSGDFLGYSPNTGSGEPGGPSRQNWLDGINIAHFGHFSAASSIHFDSGIMENHLVSLAITQQPHSSQPIRGPAERKIFEINNPKRTSSAVKCTNHTFIEHLIGAGCSRTSGSAVWR